MRHVIHQTRNKLQQTGFSRIKMTGTRRPRNNSDGNYEDWENLNNRDISDDENDGEEGDGDEYDDDSDESDIEIPPDPAHIARMAVLR